MSEPRIWLIGEHNPYGADPHYALFPRPERAAGARLCRVLGLREREYLRAFERRNLLTELPWSAPRARKAAVAILAEQPPEDRLVLLGEKVSAAFGVPWREKLFEPQLLRVSAAGDERLTLVLPHPSGLSRAWNDPAAAERTRAGIAALREMKLVAPTPG